MAVVQQVESAVMDWPAPVEAIAAVVAAVAAVVALRGSRDRRRNRLADVLRDLNADELRFLQMIASLSAKYDVLLEQFPPGHVMNTKAGNDAKVEVRRQLHADTLGRALSLDTLTLQAITAHLQSRGLIAVEPPLYPAYGGDVTLHITAVGAAALRDSVLATADSPS
jgi:hypothetical protein